MQNNTKMDHSHLVAGAAAAGHGCAFAWEGAGSRALGWVSDLAQSTGVIEVSALPKSKDPSTHLTRAIRKTIGSLYHAEQVEPLKGETFVSRWSVETRGSRTVTPVAGALSDRSIVLVATLNAEGVLSIDSINPELADKVRAEFKARVDAETLDATDITTWLKGVVLDRFDGVRMGGGLVYVPRRFRLEAEALLSAFKASGWGVFSPIIEFASGEELAAGAAWGIEQMCSAVVDDFTKARATAAKNREKALAKNPESKASGDLTKEGAEAFMVRLRLAMEKAVRYSAILGSDRAHGVKVAIDDAMITVDQILMSVDLALEWQSANFAGAKAAA